MVDVQVYSADLPRVIRRLKEVGNPLVIRAEIRGGMSAVGPQARMVVRQAALAIPSKGRQHTGLRQRIGRAASARTVNEATGPALIVGIQRSVMGQQRSLPGHINTGQWRHPLFGNKLVWVTQVSGGRNWFTNAVHRIVPVMEQSMHKTADGIARKFVK